MQRRLGETTASDCALRPNFSRKLSGLNLLKFRTRSRTIRYLKRHFRDQHVQRTCRGHMSKSFNFFDCSETPGLSRKSPKELVADQRRCAFDPPSFALEPRCWRSESLPAWHRRRGLRRHRWCGRVVRSWNCVRHKLRRTDF